MTPPPSPPWVADILLRVVTARTAWRESICGDLREEYVALADDRGFRSARAWYWRQALTLTARLAVARVGARRGAIRPFLASDGDERRRWRRGWSSDLVYAWRATVQPPDARNGRRRDAGARLGGQRDHLQPRGRDRPAAVSL
ncbi:MAG: hypothetical protein ACT4QD_23100 [Acidobacteriota bacterium]